MVKNIILTKTNDNFHKGVCMKHFNSITYFSPFILIALLSGCAAKTILINEKYSGQQNTKKEMIIFPIIYDSLIVINWDDVVDDFEVDSANCKSLIYDTLSTLLPHNSKSYTRNLIIKDGADLLNWNEMKKNPGNYFTFTQRINEKYEVDFQIPKKEFFDSSAVDNLYALIIKKMIIGRNIDRQTGVPMYTPGQVISTPDGTVQAPGTYTSSWSPENLAAVTEFIIWDYEKNDFVKCGKVITKHEFPFGMTTGSWLSLFRTIPRDLFKDTPMGVKTTSY